MTSRELTSGFDFLSRGHLRMALMHLPVIFGAYILSSPELLTIFRNSRWRLLPSWIFRLWEFGHSDVLLVWHLCSVQNVLKYTQWLLRSTHLCFKRLFDDVTRINFRFQLLVTGHMRMAVLHLPLKFGADIFIQSRVIDIFPKFKMAAAAILNFQIMWIWLFGCVDSVVFVFCTKLG